jgi:nucleotide-binding universal stress UspA family protein
MADLEALNLRHLLVAIDGSSSSELALRGAVTAAQRDRAVLTLMTVVPDFMREAGSWPSAGAPNPAVLQTEADDKAGRLLRDTVDRMPQDISVRTVLRHGKPGPQICAQAAEHDYDAVLMGARGVGRIGALIGSVSSYVMNHSGTPVFVAHAPREQ